MSLEDIKIIIENYKPQTVKPEEIESLKTMLEHFSFEPLYPLIFDKLKEFREYGETMAKQNKKPKKNKIDESWGGPPTTEALSDLQNYIYTISLFTSIEDPKRKKPNKKKK